MKKTVAVIVALEKEAVKTIEKLNCAKLNQVAGKPVYKTVVNDCDIYIIISGIGKVNGALATQLAIDKFSPSLILNFGTAGGLYPNVKIKNFYKISKAFQYDFDLTDLDDVPLGYIQDYDRVFFDVNTDFAPLLEEKSLASSDRFTCKKEDVEKIARNSSDVFDMEGGAIAEVCTANAIPLFMIKGVSDVIGNDDFRGQYYDNAKFLNDRFPDLIIKVIEDFTK